jgi:three-Cys-motif partner protein
MQPSMMSQETITVLDDHLVCPEVGGWTEQRHRLIALYSTLFSTSMKDKWGKRVYIELYAGAGHGRVRDTSKFIAGSPLLALTVQHPFDKYIFCEENPEKLEALKVRVKRTAPDAHVAYILGNCNQKTAEILKEVPRASKDETVLSLCFADPFDIGLKFATIQALSDKLFIDFLVLLAVYSDAGRAYKHYVKEDAVKVDEFLGSTTWRTRWKVAESNRIGFPKFLAEEFAASMETMSYLPTSVDNMKPVRSDEKNLRLYYIALFSRHERALKLWKEVLKYENDQIPLWD